MPASSCMPNQSHSSSASPKARPASTGSRPDSQSVGRRPSRRVTAEANGVTRKMPAQAVAANSPASQVGRSASLSRSSSQGASMK